MYQETHTRGITLDRAPWNAHARKNIGQSINGHTIKRTREGSTWIQHQPSTAGSPRDSHVSSEDFPTAEEGHVAGQPAMCGCRQTPAPLLAVRILEQRSPDGNPTMPRRTSPLFVTSKPARDEGGRSHRRRAGRSTGARMSLPPPGTAPSPGFPPGPLPPETTSALSFASFAFSRPMWCSVALLRCTGTERGKRMRNGDGGSSARGFIRPASTLHTRIGHEPVCGQAPPRSPRSA
jgi:hypothetical protein